MCTHTHAQARTQTPLHTRAHTGSDATISCKDEAYFSRPFSTKKYKQKRYKSRCVYEKEQGQCSAWNIKEHCRHTCTGVGGDSWLFSGPYKFWTRPYKKHKMKYSSQCAYFKDEGKCSRRLPPEAELCPITCGLCVSSARNAPQLPAYLPCKRAINSDI